MAKGQGSSAGTGNSDAPDDFTGERLPVAGPGRPALCDTLDNADAADFVGDGVTARIRL